MTVDTKEDDEFIFIINKIKLNNLQSKKKF